MKGVRKSFICSLGAVMVLAALWGCNGTNIDDGNKSDSLLIVDSVTPASIQADVTGNTDPNTLFVSPPEDDTIEIEVRNMNRTKTGAGIYGDIVIDSIELSCANGSLTIGSGSSVTTPASRTIPAESSASIVVTVATGAYKLANSGTLLLTTNDVCSVVFNGEDLSGEPIISKRAIFGISYVDTP
ncbi:MAG TPA: hypothetical protein VGK94_13015 [Candidatus Polarisedimenticolia bacterium]